MEELFRILPTTQGKWQSLKNTDKLKFKYHEIKAYSFIAYSTHDVAEIAQNKEAPFFAAFTLGLLTAIAPCPLATNITATAFIAKTISNRKKDLLSGLFYTFGRIFSYTTIGAIIYIGASNRLVLHQHLFQTD